MQTNLTLAIVLSTNARNRVVCVLSEAEEGNRARGSTVAAASQVNVFEFEVSS